MPVKYGPLPVEAYASMKWFQLVFGLAGIQPVEAYANRKLFEFFLKLVLYPSLLLIYILPLSLLSLFSPNIIKLISLLSFPCSVLLTPPTCSSSSCFLDSLPLLCSFFLLLTLYPLLCFFFFLLLAHYLCSTPRFLFATLCFGRHFMLIGLCSTRDSCSLALALLVILGCWPLLYS